MLRSEEIQGEYQDGMKCWFAVRVKSGTERSVALMARQKDIEDFLPLYKARRRWSDRYKSVELPLFPGYIFCRLDPARRLPLLIIPGVMHMVGVGKTPLPVDEAEISALQVSSKSCFRTEPWPYLHAGESVRIADGPLSGVEGLLIEVRKQSRLVLSVTLLNRSVAVEIERDWAVPLKSRPAVAYQHLSAACV